MSYYIEKVPVAAPSSSTVAPMKAPSPPTAPVPMYAAAGASVGGAGGFFSASQTEPLTTKRKTIAPTDLPELPEYLQAKAELSSIMRDFTDNKIYFLGLDNHVIAMAEYQSISKFTKTGVDPGKFMQGKAKTYKTGYNKKANTFTENRLFIPKFEYYSAAVKGAVSGQQTVITEATLPIH